MKLKYITAKETKNTHLIVFLGAELDERRVNFLVDSPSHYAGWQTRESRQEEIRKRSRDERHDDFGFPDGDNVKMEDRPAESSERGGS